VRQLLHGCVCSVVAWQAVVHGDKGDTEPNCIIVAIQIGCANSYVPFQDNSDTMASATISTPAQLTSEAVQRQSMIDSQLRTSDVTDPAVIAGFVAVDRSAHVPAQHRAAAYADRAISLGNSRALNPCLATARMIADLTPVAGRHVLLIGGATGYAAAVLAAMGAIVTAVEVDAALSAIARDALSNNHQLRWVEGALTDPLPTDAVPEGGFDAMMIDGAVETLPAALLEGLRAGAPIVGGINDRGVTRLGRSVNAGAEHAARLMPFADMECVPLPGFAPAPRFVF
jgi:protein-L-isoaspartate(D-aspartate) O-methyltransferase